MHCSKRREEQITTKELRKEVERQADLIFQLRQDNATLKAKLANEKDMCKIYVERLRLLQNQQTSETHVQEKNATENFQSLSILGCNRDGAMDDGAAITIMTQLQTQPSEGSGMDDSTCCSDHEDHHVVCDMETGNSTQNKVKKQGHGFFHQKGNQKQHRRKVSLRQLQCRLQCIEQFCHSNKETSNSPRVCKQRKRTEPVQRRTGENAEDNPSRIGWTGKESNQKLNLVKETYAQQTEVFDDDLKFMREVLSGASHAPEMDVEVELDKLVKDFKAWRKQFEESVKSLQASLKPIIPRRCASVPPQRLEPKKALGQLGRRSAVTTSIGKLFHRSGSVNGDQRQERTVTGSK